MAKRLLLLLVAVSALGAQAPEAARSIPVYVRNFTADGKAYAYQVAGRAPEAGGTTTIPVVLVPVELTFEAGGRKGQRARLDPAKNARAIVQSPLFHPTAFATGTTQYGDAMLRTSFHQAAKEDWHTLLGQPTVSATVKIEVPAANGYVLHSKRTGKSLAIADLDFVQQRLFEQAASVARPGVLLLAITQNTAFYSLGDATVCCSVGSHGVRVLGPGKTGQEFVLASYFDEKVMPKFVDVQAVSQQVGEWLLDPWHGFQNNEFPNWLKPPQELSCGGKGGSSAYLMEQPTDFLPDNATEVRLGHRRWHLENMALPAWFMQAPTKQLSGGAYSFPDTNSLKKPAQACSTIRGRDKEPTALPLARKDAPNGHLLIGYWEGYASARTTTPLRDVSPQWDVVIVTFATPVKGSTSELQFEPPAALGPEKLKADIKYLQRKGRKVLISLGGGGQVVTLNSEEDRRRFVSSVSKIVDDYGFDGVDLDIETPSLLIDKGDTDFRKPTTPSLVNLIAAMHELRKRFGETFMIGEVPEAAQAQAGLRDYAGQFGSFLAVIYGTRDILSFVDAQDYNTPPLEALDGNYYFPGNADYHVALAEMLMRGFPVGGDARLQFPALPPEKIAIGLPATPSSARNYTSIPDIESALRYLIDGKRYTGGNYKLLKKGGYPQFSGAMFWAINADRRNNYAMSNAIGGLLHGTDEGGKGKD